MALSYLLTEKEEISSHLAAVQVAHDDIREALATPGDPAAAWSIQEPLPGPAFLCRGFRSPYVLQALHELDVVTFRQPDSLVPAARLPPTRESGP